MFQVIKEVQTSIQDVTGVNEAMTGTQGGSDALVGVVEAQIQRGSLVQEPFYWALTSVLSQAYEHIANVAKSIYYDNPRRLSMMVGDKGMQRIEITKDHLLQDYRIFVKRSETEEQAEQAGNTLLFTLLQAGMIDQDMFANLFGRATPDRIADALRKRARLQSQVQADSEKAQIQGQQQGMQDQSDIANMMGEAEAQEGEMDELNREAEHRREMEKIAFKEQMKNERK
jgi:hypothetical protein